MLWMNPLVMCTNAYNEYVEPMELSVALRLARAYPRSHNFDTGSLELQSCHAGFIAFLRDKRAPTFAFSSHKSS